MLDSQGRHVKEHRRRQNEMARADVDQTIRWSEMLARFFAAPPSRTVAVVTDDDKTSSLTFHSTPHSLLQALLLLEDTAPSPSLCCEFTEHLQAQHQQVGASCSTFSFLAHSLLRSLPMPAPVPLRSLDADASSRHTLNRGVYIAGQIALDVVDSCARLSRSREHELLPSLPPPLRAVADAIVALLPSMELEKTLRRLNLVPQVPAKTELTRVLPTSGVLIPLRSATDVCVLQIPIVDEEHSAAVLSEEALTELSKEEWRGAALAELMETVKKASRVTMLFVQGPCHDMPRLGEFLSACARLSIRVVDRLSRAECDRICAMTGVAQRSCLADVMGCGRRVMVGVFDAGGKTGVHDEQFYRDPDDAGKGVGGLDASDLFVHVYSEGGLGTRFVNVMVCGLTDHLAAVSLATLRKSVCVRLSNRAHGRVVPAGGLLEVLVAKALEQASLCLVEEGGEEGGELAAITGKVGRCFEEMAVAVGDAELDNIYRVEAKKKRSKFTKEELSNQQHLVVSMNDEINKIKELQRGGYVKMAAGSGAGGGGAVVSMAESSLFTANLGDGGSGGVGARGVEMTAAQGAQVQAIKERDAAFDQQISEIGKGVLDLQDIAVAQNEEVKRQNMMLDSLQGKLDNVHDHVSNVNSKMKTTLDTVGRKTDKFCMDIICIVLAVGFAAVIFSIYKETN
ncbi:hypothetical protein TeGR_g9903 [Tetraparma gracilis]|uniref:t-SNARE coiled-coil homology domain-containing protein n=1 Tax=Tetraparma gracilis TaxID=2962635 RepID=A0ABQ6MD30_9STRA|nr:hypothetical protein TeGR_g9903 [Tetraparma gracilis]